MMDGPEPVIEESEEYSQSWNDESDSWNADQSAEEGHASEHES